ALHARVHRVDDAADEIVRLRTGRHDLLELHRDRVRLEHPDPDRENGVAVGLLENDDRHVRDRVDHEPLDLHLDRHRSRSREEFARGGGNIHASFRRGQARGAATSPLSEKAVDRVISSISRRPGADAPEKFTMRASGVLPVHCSGSRLLGPSTRTSTVRPTKRRWRRSWIARCASWRRPRRSFLTEAGTASRCSAAAVPGRSEYVNEYTVSNSTSARRSSVARKSSSVSVGNPTMTSVPSETSGIRARSERTRAR